MKDNIAISFIVPVYNVEDYLEQCVNSILDQASADVEIILVDDGSKDRSGLLCDEFAQKSPLVQVIHQPNSGHSAARNAGLSAAKGKYISFVDSDDFIDNDCLVRMITWAKEQDADLCFLNGYKYFPDGRTAIIDVFPDRSEISGRSAIEALNALSRCEKFPGSACSKLIKREMLINNGIIFPSNILHGEDLRFIISCMLAAKKFDYFNIDYYYYRQAREGSVTSAVNKDRTFEDLASFVTDTIVLADNNTEKRDVLYSFAAYEYAVMLSSYCRLSEELKKTACRFFKDHRWILKYGKSKKNKLVSVCISVLGFGLTFRLMDLWLRIR